MAEQSILIVDDNPVNLKLIRILLTAKAMTYIRPTMPRKLPAYCGSCGRG